MNIDRPLPLYHSWPLFEAAERMDMALLRAFPVHAPPLPAGIGLWDCDLADNRLTWTQGVYTLFGLPQDEPIDRALTVSLYQEGSRAVMEQMRAHAIRYRRGFTVDAQIRQPGGDERWMRLSAMPVLEGRKVVRLRGMKMDVTADYDAPVVRAPSLWPLSLAPSRSISPE